jgi:hypothetical protein
MQTLFSWWLDIPFNVFKALFMSSFLFKFSKAAKLFEILIWYSFITSQVT